MNTELNQKPLTLEEFRASKIAGLKNAEWCREMGIDEESVNAAEYAGGTFIFINGENSYSLIITNQEWQSADLAELEEILYREWYLPECAGVSRDSE